MCENCEELRLRVVSLQQEIVKLEERRSRERTRHINKEQMVVLKSIDYFEETDERSCTTCVKLLELLQRLVTDNPQLKGLDAILREFESFNI
jgi:hypothetical protein